MDKCEHTYLYRKIINSYQEECSNCGEVFEREHDE